MCANEEHDENTSEWYVRSMHTETDMNPMIGVFRPNCVSIYVLTPKCVV